nr:zinc finger protein 37 [Quercus suber]
MAVRCEDCNRTFGTRQALQQHLRDAPAHATTFDCNECDRGFLTEQALQHHLRDAPAHAITFDCNECDRGFLTEQALQQHLRDAPAHTTTFDCAECDRTFVTEQAHQQHVRDTPAHAARPAAGVSQSFDIRPALHDEVLQSLRTYGLTFDFFTADDPHGALEEYDTSIMGTFICAERSCPTNRWTSWQIAVTIRQYPGRRYNARVYSQRCRACGALSRPELDESYAARVSYRLARWSGVAVEAPPYSDGSRRPHRSNLCEGCRYGRCQQSRL